MVIRWTIVLQYACTLCGAGAAAYVCGFQRILELTRLPLMTRLYIVSPPNVIDSMVTSISASLLEAEEAVELGEWGCCVDALIDGCEHLKALSTQQEETEKDRIGDCNASITLACQCTGCISLCASSAASYVEAGALALTGDSSSSSSSSEVAGIKDDLTQISKKLIELARKLAAR